MKKIAPRALLLICSTVVAYSQERPPLVLIHAAQCLEAKKFLPPSNATNLTFGYFLDDKSYPDEKVIYVVNYPTDTLSNGLVFAVFLNKDNGHQKFDVQNNGRFVLSKGELSGVSFRDPPLGGAWTQGHLASAIKEIEKQPRFIISAKEVSTVDTSISCVAYTDPQRKKPQN